MTIKRREPIVLLLVTAALLILSGVRPTDRMTWWLEVAPVIIGMILLPAPSRRLPLPPLLCRLLFIHACILMLGGHYTYAQAPLGFWFQDLFDLSRNHYDRLGHLAQGFVPAILARELLLRKTGLKPGSWLFYLCVSCALAFSAFFEMIEWWSAVIMGGKAEAFLATQGDIWDTQWDMFLAMCGAILSQLLFARQHDRELGLMR